MPWQVIATDEFREGYRVLDVDQRNAVTDVVDLLEQDGPNLRRPHVGLIVGSQLPNLKELRISEGGALRVLFIFDPRRNAVLLLGGDKTGEWEQWYLTAIPEAERLYGEYLQEREAGG